MSFAVSALETTIGRLLYPLRGRDAKLFISVPFMAAISAPRIAVRSPDYSPQTPETAGSATQHRLRPEHTQIGANRFPSLAWTIPAALQNQVESFMVIVEDPDAPLSQPVVHGIYYGLSATKTTLDHGDIELLERSRGGSRTGGIRYGRNRPNTVWAAPRPIRGHGVHRYFFQVIGLRGAKLAEEKVETRASGLTKEELLEKCLGKVVTWGVWIGTFQMHFGSK